jgi:predicted nucleic acid-binding protein
MIYLDTSYLVRLYVRQPGSDEVETWLIGKQNWVCCQHGRLETISAFKRQQREGHIDARGVRAALRQMENDEASGLLQWLPITNALIARACRQMAELPPTVFLRAADALHLSCAAEARLREIYSHDRHLLAAASQFKLKGIDILKTP